MSSLTLDIHLLRLTLLASLVMPCGAVAVFAQAVPPAVQEFALRDTKGLTEHNIQASAAEFKGRQSVRLVRPPSDEGGLAILPGTEDFADGTIEVDLALKVTVTGHRMPGFVGVAFRVRPDTSHYELFYLRPGNSVSNDQAMRNHSVQYSSEPLFSWYKLRREWPAVYEAYADLQPEAWTKLKITVAGRNAKLYLNGSESPGLVVNGLKGEDAQGAIALWGYAGEEAYFSNMRITRAATAQPLPFDGEASGVWDVTLNGDAAMIQGNLKLTRDGSNITGKWSGPLGDNLDVAGTWRRGYVELHFTGNWPEGASVGTPGSVNTVLAGWIEGASASGRFKIEGHTDGLWSATRKPPQ